jgi:hypothetical protein
VNSGFKVFDTHTHVGTAQHSGRSLRAEQLLASMDRFGVDRSVVIPFPMVEDYRATHDEIGRAVAAYPDRLIGAACIDPFIPEQAFRDEVRRCAQDLGFRALKLQPQYQALNPLSSRSDFFFETALENHLAAICHTGSGVPFALPSLFIWPARKFPKLPIILAHSGSSLFVAEPIVAASVCPNIYLELSSHDTRSESRHFVEHGGSTIWASELMAELCRWPRFNGVGACPSLTLGNPAKSSLAQAEPLV